MKSALITEQQEMHRIFHLFEHYVTTHPAFTIRFFPLTGYFLNRAVDIITALDYHPNQKRRALITKACRLLF